MYFFLFFLGGGLFQVKIFLNIIIYFCTRAAIKSVAPLISKLSRNIALDWRLNLDHAKLSL